MPAWGLSEDGSRPVDATPVWTACEPPLADGAGFVCGGLQFDEASRIDTARAFATRHELWAAKR